MITQLYAKGLKQIVAEEKDMIVSGEAEDAAKSYGTS